MAHLPTVFVEQPLAWQSLLTSSICENSESYNTSLMVILVTVVTISPTPLQKIPHTGDTDSLDR